MAMATRREFAIAPPVEPMLAKVAEAVPESRDFLFEPKWDGFRAIMSAPQGERRSQLEKFLVTAKVTSAFTMAMRHPLRKNAMKNHPWRDWADAAAAEANRMPGASSRWSAGKDLSWEALRVERVCEVKHDHLQGDRFRHAAIFQRWRPDKPPQECGYDQLEVTTPYELARVFTSGR